MSKIDGIGCKGGTSATAGKKLIRQGVIFSGETYEFGAFRQYPYIVVSQKDDAAKQFIFYKRDMESVRESIRFYSAHDYLIAFWLPVTPAPYRTITAADLLAA